MDLGLLVASERAAEGLLRDAVAALAVDDRVAAEQALRRSLFLKRDRLAESLLASMQHARRPLERFPPEPTAPSSDHDLRPVPIRDPEHGG